MEMGAPQRGRASLYLVSLSERQLRAKRKRQDSPRGVTTAGPRELVVWLILKERDWQELVPA